MFKAKGKISNALRGKKLPEDVQIKVDRTEPAPSADAVRHGSGYGLGAGATRRRSGKDQA